MAATRTSRELTGSRQPRRVGGIVLVVVGVLILGADAILLMLTLGLSGFEPGASRGLHHWSTFFAWASIGLLYVGLGAARPSGRRRSRGV